MGELPKAKERADNSGWVYLPEEKLWLSPGGEKVAAPPPPPKKVGGKIGNRGGNGRRTKYKAAFVKVARRACERGMTDGEIAEMLNVSPGTLWKWRKDNRLFAESFTLGREFADNRVERALYERAVGYTFDQEKAVRTAAGQDIIRWKEHLPPDVTACLAYLKNRRPDRWRERSTIEHMHSVYDEIETAAELRELLTKQAAALGLIGPVVDITPEPEQDAARSPSVGERGPR